MNRENASDLNSLNPLLRSGWEQSGSRHTLLPAILQPHLVMLLLSTLFAASKVKPCLAMLRIVRVYVP